MSHENVNSFVSTQKITYKTRKNKVQYLFSQFFMQNNYPTGTFKVVFCFTKQMN